MLQARVPRGVVVFSKVVAGTDCKKWQKSSLRRKYTVVILVLIICCYDPMRCDRIGKTRRQSTVLVGRTRANQVGIYHNVFAHLDRYLFFFSDPRRFQIDQFIRMMDCIADAPPTRVEALNSWEQGMYIWRAFVDLTMRSGDVAAVSLSQKNRQIDQAVGAIFYMHTMNIIWDTTVVRRDTIGLRYTR